jgi:hypothetical protein
MGRMIWTILGAILAIWLALHGHWLDLRDAQDLSLSG